MCPAPLESCYKRHTYTWRSVLRWVGKKKDKCLQNRPKNNGSRFSRYKGTPSTPVGRNTERCVCVCIRQKLTEWMCRYLLYVVGQNRLGISWNWWNCVNTSQRHNGGLCKHTCFQLLTCTSLVMHDTYIFQVKATHYVSMGRKVLYGTTDSYSTFSSSNAAHYVSMGGGV